MTAGTGIALLLIAFAWLIGFRATVAIIFLIVLVWGGF